MKRTIKLTENELRKMVAESVKRVLNEGRYGEIKKVYHQLMDNIDTLVDYLHSEGYVGDGCIEGNNLVEKLLSTRDDIHTFFAQADVGGNKKVWDSVGF